LMMALGGQAFQGVRDSDCNGEIAELGHNGEVVIYTPFREMWLLPDKIRTEYTSNGQILVTVFNGQNGWMLDKTGVSDRSDDAAKNLAELVMFGMDNILRLQSSGEGTEFYYAGKGSIDSKEVEWIESSDHNNRERRLAIEKATHLPLRWVVSSKDLETGERIEETADYAHFVSIAGVQTSLSISHTQNGRTVSQVFVTSCRYNSDLSPELFTRAALEHRQKEVVKKDPK